MASKYIAFTGGKGGTGKSTLAINIATLIAMEKKTLLVDMDVECPNDHILLAIDELQNPKDVHIFQPKFIPERCVKCGVCRASCAENAIVQFKDGFPFLLPRLCSGCRTCEIVCKFDAIAEDRKNVGKTYKTEYTHSSASFTLITGVLNEGEERSFHVAKATRDRAMDLKGDVYIFDTAAGTTNDVAISLITARIIFAVCEPTPLGIHDLGMILELCDKIGINKRYLIINRSNIGDQDAMVKIKALAHDYEAEIIASIPYDRGIIESYIHGIPYVLWQKASQNTVKEFEAVAEVIT